MEEKQKSTILDKDLEIENMREFLLEHQDIKLENLPKYEDLIKPETLTSEETKIEGMQEVNTLPIFEPKIKKKEEKQTNNLHQKRFKIAVGCFAVIGVLFLALTLINGVSLTLLANEKINNQKDITTLTEEVAELKYDVDNSLGADAEKVGYKLALPRNYPDDTSKLTWFDKFSIFLMKLFG